MAALAPSLSSGLRERWKAFKEPPSVTCSAKSRQITPTLAKARGQIVCFQLAGEQAAFINVQLAQLEDVELGIEALLQEVLDRGAESRLAFGGSRDAAVPEAR